jgi:hypothetical protein
LAFEKFFTADRLAQVLCSVDEGFCSQAPDGRKFAELYAATAMSGGMGSGAGISGTGKLAVDAGGVAVFDPCVVRDRARAWLGEVFERLAGDPEGEEARAVYERIRDDFAPAAEEPDA